MISKFSVLYVGHLDLEGVGLGGKPADERWYPNERFQEAYWTAREVAQMMDERGFWCLWTAEHHFQREGYEVFPNLILLNTWLATQTQRLKLGCAFNVLPTWHPIRLAEDFAVADIVTSGRIVFGIGRGYQTREVESLGAPLLDGDANRELFEEQVELLMKALNEESFSHQGRHYQVPAPVEYRGRPLENVTVVPRPLNRPVEVWQAIASGRSIPYMAHRGIKGMISLTGEQIALEMAELYQAEAAKVGRELELGDGLCLGFGLYLADSEQEAIDRVRPYHDERYKWFAQFGLVRYTDEHGRVWGTPGAPARIPTIEDGVEQKAWLCGRPEDVIERLQEWEARYPGLDQVMIHWAEGMPREEFKEQLQWFATDVMPAFLGRS